MAVVKKSSMKAGLSLVIGPVTPLLLKAVGMLLSVLGNEGVLPRRVVTSRGTCRESGRLARRIAAGLIFALALPQRHRWQSGLLLPLAPPP